MKASSERMTRVAITSGDLNGIGIEVVLKALEDSRMIQQMIQVLYAPSKVVSFYRKELGLEEVQTHRVKDITDLATKRLNVLSLSDEDVEVTPGRSSRTGAEWAIRSLEAATHDLASGKVDVLVTAPIDKHAMNTAGFDFPGHTEYLADLANTKEYLMILIAGDLRVGTVTGHIPIKDVHDRVNKELICSKARILHTSLLRDMGIIRPKIAILSLDPHAGDHGTIGKADAEVVAPAVRQLQDEGMLAMGPFPADGYFGSSQLGGYDAALAMYHDQGLAPFKALSFGSGVNYTAGLPIVRTSPDHGTAYDIAGKGLADGSSMRSAIWLACDVLHQREVEKELNADPLPFGMSKGKR